MSDNKHNNNETFIYCTNNINEVEFDTIFNLYYDKLLFIAKNYISRPEDAEEIVQDVFIKLWKKKKDLNININLNGYLFKMTKNACLDHLRKKSRQLQKHGHYEQIENWLNYNALSDNNASEIIQKELASQIIEAINILPEKCKHVFIKSRIEGLAHKDISEQLQISIKTVENHIGKALKHMRFHLQEFLHLF
ncbi:RNA polymerase sigma-70 factor [Abyssalbus ytuae]|uniref:RNA polymerase sigma-70 factor n=1 Tax=Abyssalbus ytuae TaxID=2926907 RepID=A0A9E6ZXS9_9FLAO|nr:RNA polymerase sigma-70 factor [Abyssalbus ytuae]UOB17137.1 RNA polymerase sigma-70 factor [Abyssalbus ytuae]